MTAPASYGTLLQSLAAQGVRVVVPSLYLRGLSTLLGRVSVVEEAERAVALIESIVLGNGGSRHTETLRALVQAGANVNAQEEGGVTPLALAATNADEAMIARLLDGDGSIPAGRVRSEDAIVIADRAAAAPLDLGRFHDHQARAAGGVAAGIHQVPVGGEALLRRILVHGRHDNPVLQGNVADGNRLEQFRSRHCIVLAQWHL